MKTIFQNLKAYTKQDAYYVPRDYQTMGGMWTVDTWSRDVITLQVMDEGYTTVIRGPGFQVVEDYSGKMEWKEGSEAIAQDYMTGRMED